MADRVIRTRLEFLLYRAALVSDDDPLRVAVADAQEFRPGMRASDPGAFKRATSLAEEFAREHLPALAATYVHRTEVPDGFLKGEVAIVGGGQHVRVTGEGGKLVVHSVEPVQIVEKVPLREFLCDGDPEAA